MHHLENFLEKKKKLFNYSFCKKEKIKNLIIYDAINKILIKIIF